MTAKQIAACAFFLTASYCGFSQRMDLTGGSIGISYTVLPTQSLKDTSGGFGYHAFGVNLNIPLFGNRYKIVANTLQDGHPHFYQVSGHANFESMQSNIGFITPASRTIYQAGAGFGGLFYNGKKNIILADLNMGISSDGLAIKNDDLKFRYSGSFIVNHIHNSTVMYQYGLVLNYAFGRPLPLPVLGIRKKFAKNWTFSAILPVSLQLADRLNKKMSVSVSIRPSGNRFQLENRQNFNTTSSSVYMQLRQFELGLSYQYRFAKQFSFGAEAGLLAGGKLRFTEPNDNKTIIYQSGIKPGARFRFSLRYHLPHKKTAGNKMDIENELLRMN